MEKARKKTSADLLKRVRDTIVHYGMLEKGDRVLVAVSGGPDSVALLRVLFALRSKLGIEVLIANLDHGVRGKESAEESRFVKDLAGELSLECVQEKLGPFKAFGGKISLEEKLRKKRYNFLVSAAEKKGCNVVATGHTIDDQSETVVMRFIKGVSLDGLAGIPPVRQEKGIRLIRPLIRTSKKEIMAFISTIGAAYVQDSSNYDVKFLRNRVRAEVLPFLEKMNPALKASLSNLADFVREETVFSSLARKEKARKAVFLSGSACHVRLKEYLAQPQAVRREIFKELFSFSGGNVKKMAYRHWMIMDAFARTQSKGRSLDLPGKVRVIKSRGKISFIKA